MKKSTSFGPDIAWYRRCNDLIENFVNDYDKKHKKPKTLNNGTELNHVFRHIARRLCAALDSSFRFCKKFRNHSCAKFYVSKVLRVSCGRPFARSPQDPGGKYCLGTERNMRTTFLVPNVSL
ncbi:unnamed protein product [Amoebophrya sp. A120]|nr:unnamed protein product [Amoebophrya sp. A120]|eukprot:GSA120T00002237001.1